MNYITKVYKRRKTVVVLLLLLLFIAACFIGFRELVTNREAPKKATYVLNNIMIGSEII